MHDQEGRLVDNEKIVVLENDAKQGQCRKLVSGARVRKGGRLWSGRVKR
jgi:hypothetical protein